MHPSDSRDVSAEKKSSGGVLQSDRCLILTSLDCQIFFGGLLGKTTETEDWLL